MRVCRRTAGTAGDHHLDGVQGVRQVDRHRVGHRLALGDQDLQHAPRDGGIDPYGRAWWIHTGEVAPDIGSIDDHRADQRPEIDVFESYRVLPTQRALEVGQAVDESIEFGAGLDDRVQAPLTKAGVEVVAAQQLDLVRQGSDEMPQVVADRRDQPAGLRAGAVRSGAVRTVLTGAC